MNFFIERQIELEKCLYNGQKTQMIIYTQFGIKYNSIKGIQPKQRTS
jgi:hypothetical protein